MRAGFNSGVLRHCGFNLIDTIHFVKKLGTNAFELSFFDSAMLLDFELDDEIIDLLNSFDYLSIHAPYHSEPTSAESSLFPSHSTPQQTSSS